MAIDTSLIKGAEFAATGGSPTGGYIDPAKYLSPGIKKFTDQIEAGIKKSEDAFASLMDDFDSYVDLSKFNDNQMSVAKNWLVDKKRKYSDIASKLSTMQRTDPKYSELTDELNRIQGAINTFAQQKKGYISDRIGMKDSDFSDYSTIDSKRVEDYRDMYKNDAVFTVDETGNIIFKNSEGKDIPYYLREEPDLKAINQAKAINVLEGKIIESAISGKKIDRDLLDLNLNEIIKTSQQSRSLLQDGLLSNKIINIPEDFKLEKDDKAIIEQTKNLIAESLMNIYNTKYKPEPVELSAAQKEDLIETRNISNYINGAWGETEGINYRGLSFTKTGENIYKLQKFDKEGNDLTESSPQTFSSPEILISYIKLHNKEK